MESIHTSKCDPRIQKVTLLFYSDDWWDQLHRLVISYRQRGLGVKELWLSPRAFEFFTNRIKDYFGETDEVYFLPTVLGIPLNKAELAEDEQHLRLPDLQVVLLDDRVFSSDLWDE